MLTPCLIIPPQAAAVDPNVFHPCGFLFHLFGVLFGKSDCGRAAAYVASHRQRSMAHEEEVLGKAYDSRLMRRLLTYLRPYRWQVALAFASIILKAFADVLGPYLTKVAVDRYLTPTKAGASGLWNWLSPRPLTGVAQIAAIYVGLLVFTFLLEFLQTYFMQWTGQK